MKNENMFPKVISIARHFGMGEYFIVKCHYFIIEGFNTMTNRWKLSNSDEEKYFFHEFKNGRNVLICREKSQVHARWGQYLDSAICFWIGSQ